MNMNIIKVLLIAGFLAMLTMVMPAAQVWAGVEPPPTTGTIQGPELWGVIVIDCTANFATLRVKRIVDCNVETQAVTMLWGTTCPQDETDPLWWKLEGIILFDYTGIPIITKVKNFKNEPGTEIYSFDAQIKFWIAP